ncbi:MAG TPA: hypothetical protein VGX28_16095 [Frankiaceae bacterium]|jgi:hypothetical protein|nr:hypothetical protein [Frankiaceae bacterium]
MNAITASAKQRLAGLLLLAGTGVVGTLAYALIAGGDSPATPAGQTPPSGTGTVIGATPTPGAPSQAPPAPPVAGVFFISGSVEGLVPGTATTMPLTVANPNPWPIQVLTVDTGVAVPASVTCAAGTVDVGDYSYDEGDAVLTAPANGTVRVDVPVRMVDSLTVDQTACKGTTFALTFDGTARQVSS